MYDQASMVREFVKWDYEPRDGVQVAAVLDRAIDIAMTAPRGQVYLSLPREVLARLPRGLRDHFERIYAAMTVRSGLMFVLE